MPSCVLLLQPFSCFSLTFDSCLAPSAHRRTVFALGCSSLLSTGPLRKWIQPRTWAPWKTHHKWTRDALGVGALSSGHDAMRLEKNCILADEADRDDGGVAGIDVGAPRNAELAGLHLGILYKTRF